MGSGGTTFAIKIEFSSRDQFPGCTRTLPLTVLPSKFEDDIEDVPEVTQGVTGYGRDHDVR